jgi:hypothetical protein
MSRIYAQATPDVLKSSGSLAAKALISGSLASEGYARIVGIVRSDASATGAAASGLSIWYSTDYGANFKVMSACYAVTACAASLINMTNYGTNIKVLFYNGATAASNVDIHLCLYPI